MSKSTLSIAVPVEFPRFNTRTIEVPCRLPEAFDFKAFVGGRLVSASVFLTGYGDPKTSAINEVTGPGPLLEAATMQALEAVAETILATVKSVLGLSPAAHSVAADVILVPIAIAYEAEVAAYDAVVKAHAALPRALHSPSLLRTHPDDSLVSPSRHMLAKYVEHVVEQACKAQTERAEQAAKVLPFPSQVTP